jgi:cytochrome c biogenesis factor
MPDLRKSKDYMASSKPTGCNSLDELTNHQSDGLLKALSNTNVLLIIPVFLVGIFRYPTLNILIQYSSVQFRMKISTGARFYTETAIVNIVFFLFLIPLITSNVRLKYQTRPETIDLVLVRLSVCAMCLGCISIGLARSSYFLPIGKSDSQNLTPCCSEI